MGLIVAFDLDDTLYRELDFVESGFRAVAAFVEREHCIPLDDALAILHRSLQNHGRGRQFDDLLRAHDLYTATRRKRLIQVYRRHQSALQLADGAREVLAELRGEGHRLFLVTDGHSGVQATKITALGLWSEFEWAYITSRYGHSAAKPSTKVFELMLRRTNAQSTKLVYIGDNPAKDFVGVNLLGGTTIRVLTGAHRDASARPGHDAKFTVHSVGEVPGVLYDAGLVSR